MRNNDNNNWHILAADIENTVDEAFNKLKNLPERSIEVRHNPAEWSVKEIVGHLVDSACNNLQRFVRLQISDGLVFPDYSQDNDAWVSIQVYQVAPWDDLLALWQYFNFHIARVIRTVNKECIDHVWIVDENTSITLGELMIDYLRHLKDHLQQIRKQIDRMT
jgi:hypothetical protein